MYKKVLFIELEKAKIKAANNIITLTALHPSIIRDTYLSLYKILIEGSNS